MTVISLLLQNYENPVIHKRTTAVAAMDCSRGFEEKRIGATKVLIDVDPVSLL